MTARHRVRDRRLIGTAPLPTAVASVGGGWRGHVPPKLRKHIFGVERRCMHCAVSTVSSAEVETSMVRGLGSSSHPGPQVHVFSTCPWMWLGMYASPQPFSKHVLVFIDFFNHMVCTSSEGRVLWRAQGIRFFGDTNSDSLPSMVSVFGNCFGLYAGSRAGLGIVWIPSQYYFFSQPICKGSKTQNQIYQNQIRYSPKHKQTTRSCFCWTAANIRVTWTPICRPFLQKFWPGSSRTGKWQCCLLTVFFLHPWCPHWACLAVRSKLQTRKPHSKFA